MSAAHPMRVLVVGPKHRSANSRGGMASVVTIMREHRDPRVRIRTVATYVDDSASRRLAVGVHGMVVASVLVLARRVDVVHVHLAHRGSVVRKAAVLAAARAAHVPSVVHAHSYDFAGWFDGLGPRAAGLVRRALRASRWLVLGDALAAEYTARLRLPADQVHVLRNPAPVAAHAADPPGVGPVQAVFLGRHGARKGSYDLVAALARLAVETPDLATRLRVVAAGDGERDEVEAAARAADVSEVLDVRGWVDAAARDALLDTAAIFVLPSHDEGLPMALLEAMGRGVAPVVTPVGAVGEVVTDGVDALVVPPGDVPALADALARLVHDAPLRTRLGRAARDRATDFGEDRWFDALVTHWTALVDAAPARSSGPR